MTRKERKAYKLGREKGKQDAYIIAVRDADLDATKWISRASLTFHLDRIKLEEENKTNAIALNVACDLLIGSTLYGYDYDRIFEEIMDKEGCVSANLIKEFILEHIKELGKEYFTKEGEVE